MYSPKELEGEVDHSFFDSDCDVNSTKPEKHIHHEEEDGDVTKKTKQAEKWDKSGVETLGKEISGLKIQSELIVKDNSEGKEDMGREERKTVGKTENIEDLPEQKDHVKKDEAACGKDDSDSSSRKSSPLPRSDLSNSSHGSQSDDSSIISSSSSAAEEDDDDVFKNEADGSNQSEPNKKPTRNLCNRIRSYSSSSSGEERSPTPWAKPSSTQSASSPRRQPRVRSANWKQKPKTSGTSDSDDTVTDVTPLSSPDTSPQQSVNLAPPTQSSVSVSTIDISESVDGQQLDTTTNGDRRSAVKGAGRRLNIPSPSGTSVSSGRSTASQSRKNFSFTSEEVRRIERENQRLLRELSRSSTRSSSRSTHRSSAPPFRLYHSALNRQREQQRIQRENLAFLKRLESIKATPGMTRVEQLTDYQRQAGYLGIPSPFIRPSSGNSSRTFSSISPHRSRPETAKSTRITPPQPPWS